MIRYEKNVKKKEFHKSLPLQLVLFKDSARLVVDGTL